MLPGETEAGSAGTQPCRGITWWAHRDDEISAPEPVAYACFQILIGSVDPHALKIPARRAEYSLTESALSPFQAEPTQAVKPKGGDDSGGRAAKKVMNRTPCIWLSRLPAKRS